MTRRPDPARLSERMKAFRSERHLSQQGAADQLGVGLRQWTRWEHGQHLPQAANLEALMQFLELDDSDLFEDWSTPEIRVARLENRLASVERRVAGLERIAADGDEGREEDQYTVTTWTVEAELDLPRSVHLKELEELLELDGADRLERVASNGGTHTWRFEVFTDLSSAALRLAVDYIADACASTEVGEQPTRADVRTIQKNTRVLAPEA